MLAYCFLLVKWMSDIADKIYPEVDTFSSIISGPDWNMAIIAPARGKKVQAVEECIFCPESRDKLVEPFLSGNLREEMESRDLYILRNAYPVVTPSENIPNGIANRGFYGVFHDKNILPGEHILMIETPNHNLNPFSSSHEAKEYYNNLVWGYIQMLKSLKEKGYSWAGLGKNRNGIYLDGSTIDAGASQPHPHSQAISMDFVPRNLDRILFELNRHPGELKRDSLGELLPACPSCQQDRDGVFQNIKLVFDGMHVSYVVPNPTLNPYHIEIRIAPINHQSHFEEMSLEQSASFATVLHETMIKLNKSYPNMGYNFELKQGPWKSDRYGIKNVYNIKNSHWKFGVYPAWPNLDTEKNIGFISHLLGVAVLKVLPYQLAKKINQK